MKSESFTVFTCVIFFVFERSGKRKIEMHKLLFQFSIICILAFMWWNALAVYAVASHEEIGHNGQQTVIESITHWKQLQQLRVKLNRTAHLFPQQLREVQGAVMIRQKKNEEGKIAGRRHLDALASPICTDDQLGSIINEISICLPPFFQWTGHDWEDTKSVHFACSQGICPQTLKGFTTFKKQCLAAYDPILVAILGMMCTTSSSGQYCGESYIGLLNFIQCSYMTNGGECGMLAGCTWSNTDATCGANFKPSILERMCTSCLPPTVDTLSLAGNLNKSDEVAISRTLDVYCARIDDTFCMDHLPDALLNIDLAALGSFTQTIAQQTCDITLNNRCFKKVHSLFLLFLEILFVDDYEECIATLGSNKTNCVVAFYKDFRAVGHMQQLLATMCSTSGASSTDKKYCLVNIQLAASADANFLPCLYGVAFPVYGEPSICNPTCIEASLKPKLTSWGCCTGILQQIAREPPVPLIPGETTVGNGSLLMTGSGVGQGGLLNMVACSSQHTLNVEMLDLGSKSCQTNFATTSAKLTLSLAVEWNKIKGVAMEGLRVRLLTALASDLKASLGLAGNAIANGTLSPHPTRTIAIVSLVTGETNHVPGTLYQFELQGQTDLETNAARASLTAAEAGGTLSLPLSTTIVMTECASVGGCTDPSTSGILFAGPDPNGSGSERCHCIHFGILLLFSFLLLVL